MRERNCNERGNNNSSALIEGRRSHVAGVTILNNNDCGKTNTIGALTPDVTL